MMWRNEKDLMLKLIRTLKNWRVVCKNADSQAFDRVVEDLTTSLHQPRSTHRLGWSECNILKLLDGATIKFGSLNWAGELE